MLPGISIEEWDFYQSWMLPRGLPAIWPITLGVATRPLYPNAGIVILRPPGARPGAEFTPADLAFGNRLLTHLRRAFELSAEMLGDEWNRRAMHEVIERLRFGVVLLDSDRRLLKSNRSADRALASRRRLELRDRRLRATRAEDDRKLQTAISRTLEYTEMRRFHLEEFLYFGRAGEHWELDFLLKPLLSGAPGGAMSDAAMVVIFADLEEVSTFPTLAVRRLYSLSRGEGELLRLLAGGASIAQAAERRGVALNTARTQLKSIFKKTETGSQSELIQLVLAGVVAVWDEYATIDDELPSPRRSVDEP